jgi:hypothetical protein
MRKLLHTECEPRRSAVRVQGGSFVAAPFCEHGYQTESAMDFGSLNSEFQQFLRDVSFVFGVPVEG